MILHVNEVALENLSFSRYEWASQCLRELLPLAPSLLVSDIGAGSNKMRRFIEEAGGKWQGFDLITQSEEIAQWDLDQPASHKCEAAGIILLLDVLEHLKNPWNSIRNLAATLLPGGGVIFTAPNPRWSRSRFHTLFKGTPACFTQSDLDLNHHVFTPWPHIAEKIFKDEGFTIERYVTLDGATTWPGPPYNLRFPIRCAFSLLNKIIERQDSTACGMSYGIIVRKQLAAENT